LIEIVAGGEEDKQRARDRYKFYRDRGYEIRTHDLAKAGGAR
jgi:DNA polymerase III subunit chi